MPSSPPRRRRYVAKKTNHRDTEDTETSPISVTSVSLWLISFFFYFSIVIETGFVQPLSSAV